MKMALKDLNPNPFKKEINKGNLNREIIDRLKSNMKELGFMGALPVVKHKGQVCMVCGHHRVQALKEVFNDEYEIEVTFHTYDDETLLRGMVVENVTQRSDEMKEMCDNLNAVRKYIKRNDVQQLDTVEMRKDGKKRGKNQHTIPGSVRDIYDWINKHGEAISRGKIENYLRVGNDLDKSILNSKDLSFDEARYLARLDKKDQKPLRKILKNVDRDRNTKSQLVTQYKQAPEHIKEKIKQEEIPIEDVEEAVFTDIQKDKPVDRYLPSIEDMMVKVDNTWIGIKDHIVTVSKKMSLFHKHKLFKEMNHDQKISMIKRVESTEKELKQFFVVIEKFKEGLKR